MIAAVGGLLGEQGWSMGLNVPYDTNFEGTAYDPYLWMALVPLETFSLVVSVWLAWRVGWFRFRIWRARKGADVGAGTSRLRDENIML